MELEQRPLISPISHAGSTVSCAGYSVRPCSRLSQEFLHCHRVQLAQQLTFSSCWNVVRSSVLALRAPLADGIFIAQ